MAIVSPGSLFQNAGNVSGQFDRLRHVFDTIPLSGDTTTVNGAGGLWPGANMAQVTAQSTPNMTVRVDRFVALCGGSQNNAQGMYPVISDAVIPSVTIVASNTSQRIDSVVIENPDSFYSGVTNLAQVNTYQGTPGSGLPPTFSGLTNNYLEIARITVRANATTVVTGDIQNIPHYLTAPGGIGILQPYELGANGYIAGQWRDSGTTLDRWSGATWVNQLVTGVGTGQAKYTAAINATGANQPLTAGTFVAVQFINPVTTSSDVTASGTNNNTFTLNRTGEWAIVVNHRITNGSTAALFAQLLVPALTGDPFGAWGGGSFVSATWDAGFVVLDRFTSGQQFSLGAQQSTGTASIGSGTTGTGKRTSISFKWLGP
jgi:hypothetical protein